MQRTIRLNHDARAHDGEIRDVFPYGMLPAHCDAFVPKQTQPSPCIALQTRRVAPERTGAFARHAVASFGWAKARRMSQRPARIIGSESSMPMVT